MIGITLGLLGFGWTMYGTLPAQVPIHWNIMGEIDGWQSPLQTVLMLPLIGLGIGFLILGFTRLDTRPVVQRAMTHSAVAMMLFVAVVHVVIVCAAAGYAVSVPRVVVVAVAVLLACLGYVMRDVVPNELIGIRVKWTLANAVVWHETHAVASAMLASAALLLVVLALTPVATPVLFLCLFVAVIVGFGWPVIYAYRRFHHLLTDEMSHASRDE
ncbi:MAG: DUF1648 domain-containing protein, partial [Roseiflexaceae bacterium]